MEKKKINIAYIDDDESVIYGSLVDIEDEIVKMDLRQFDIDICFLEIKNEHSQDDFWERLQNGNYHGMILDYRLVDSGIFDNANSIWKRIKTGNPFFPLAIYTSKSDEVTLNENAEIIFEKGNTDHANAMIRYLLQQISHGLESIKMLENTNSELKNDSSVSYAVLKNEEKIEKQFSLFFNAEYSEEDEDQFKILIERAFEIIDKYSEDDE
ncbi:hypothetical protein DOK67_0002275 [Enterococcus sp. DIV0212c]|uniref:hypothetical protein n=1 Tax=Enterococcus sp. DIV0212c TaxID=2230867 RepID=UPI001A9A880B|nr:hypothetical protein [Enterococcus sp. DIV0212c]MBO1355320.1 hypothetical protein [Enterococcus sp. DIV0212c]